MAKMNICMAANSAYMRYQYVMLTSLFESNRDSEIVVYILQKDFTDSDKNYVLMLAKSYNQIVEFIDIPESFFAKLPTDHIYSVEVYFRLMMPELLPISLERVLYLDVDILVLKSLEELYNDDIKGYYFGACIDINMGDLSEHRQHQYGRYDDLRYFNSGVMLWNLDLIRRSYDFDSYLCAAEKLNYDLPCVDQDILNYLYYDKVKYLDPYKYNYLPIIHLCQERKNEWGKLEDVRILHFAGCSPWRNGIKPEEYRLWWKYAKMTPFYSELLEEQLFRIEETQIDGRLLQEREIGQIMELSYELKGTDKIEKKLRDKDVCIYGVGKMGHHFWKMINKECIDYDHFYIIDKKAEGDFEGIRIRNSFDWMDDEKDYIVIVTPTYQVDIVKEEVVRQVNNRSDIYKLREFLEFCYNG